MILQIAVCDDEKVTLEELEKQLNKEFATTDLEYEIHSFTNSLDLLEATKTIIFDILFLDIEMPQVTGIELAAEIRAVNNFVYIIFITNREDLVFQSIHFRPFRFIRKKYLYEELSEAILALTKKIKAENIYYKINFQNTTIEIKITEILYIESFRHDIYLNSKDTTYRIRSNLSKMEKELEPLGFIRVHSGYLVNYRYIFSIEKTKVILSNQDSIPLSRYRFEAVKQKLQLYMRDY
ncbi:MAG: Response regulator of the LytR/AlgR family [Anaerocolumna sp.]|jgi:DNA-binding LytR/AlgR family response regulator|nr:Response regulator of the LytR/AlgR family [Anaerocolumna sp.]